MSSWGRAVAVKKKAVAPEVFRGLSIIYITFRENCKFEWFIHPLIRQTAQYDRSKMEVIVVDGFLDDTNQAERRAFFEREMGNAFRLKHFLFILRPNKDNKLVNGLSRPNWKQTPIL